MAPLNAARVSRRAFLGVLGTVAIAAALPPAVAGRPFPQPGEWAQPSVLHCVSVSYEEMRMRFENGGEPPIGGHLQIGSEVVVVDRIHYEVGGDCVVTMRRG